MKRSSVRAIGLSSLLAAAPAVAQLSKPVCASSSDYATNCSTPVPDCSLPSNASNAACRGMQEVIPGYSSASCTANDVSVVLVGLGVQQDGCINASDNADVYLRSTLNVNAATRYDVAWFIPLTATDTGRTGLSQPGYLSPVASTSTYGAGLAPYHDGDGDYCGEIRSADSTTVFDYPFPVKLPCERVNAGFLSIPRCVVWDQSAGTSCSDIFGTGTNNAYNSKCNCAGSSATDIPGPNLRKSCDNFTVPSDLGPNNQLDIGETATFTINYTNTVSGCTPGAPTVNDPFGRFRCGTSSFVRMVIEYGTADARGDFFVNNGGLDLAIPTCPSTEVVDTDPGVGTNLGVVCNDTTNSRLIFAPRDPNTSNTYTVLSAFSGTQTLPIKYTLLNNVPATPVSMTSRLFWDNSVDTASPTGVISTTEAVDLTGAIQQTCADCSCSTAVQATPVTLSSFQATPAGRGVRFQWSTDTEVGNVGFNLYAMVDGEPVKLNEEPIPSHGGDSLEPQQYDIELALPFDSDSFVVEDLDIRGETRSHGPFKSGRKHGAAAEIEPIDWSAVRREHGLSRSTGGERVAFRGHEKRPSNTSARESKLAPATSAPTTIELLVDRNGLHRVTYEDLAGAGFDLAGQPSGLLGLSVRGTPVPIFVGGGTKFGPGSYIEFWGEALDTLYTKTNVYRLATGVKKAARAAVSTAAPSGAPAATYAESRKFERNRVYAYWSSAGDPFYDTAMRVFSTPGQIGFPFTIDGFDPAGGDARLRVEMFGTTSHANVKPDHHVQFLVNGYNVGESWFDDTNGVVFEGAVPASVLAEGANTLTIRQPADTGASVDIVVLDEFSVSYPRRFEAQQGRLHFAGEGERFDIAGLTDGELVAYRRQGAALTRLGGATLVADGGGFLASLPGSTGGAEFAVATRSTVFQPAAIQSMRPARDISTGVASYLIISHSAFLGGLDELIAARGAQGHTVRVVDVEDIYAQYAHGILNPEAIRTYLAHAYSAMGTRYVLLVGGDTYDYHGYLGTGAFSFIPTLYRATGDLVKWAPTDALFADVNGDNVQDLAIGRFPVRSADELARAIAKTLAYEARAASPSGIFAADIFDANANESFGFASDRVIASLSSDWQVNRVYIDQLGVSAARTKLFSDLQQGPALTLFLGHSANTAWGSAGLGATRLLMVSDVATLPNVGLPTVVAQVGCWNNYFVHPRVDSIGGKLFSVENRGAAAVLGTTTLTDDVDNNKFGAILAPLLARPGVPIGDALWQAKRAFAAEVATNSGTDALDVLFGWSLLGDPALELMP